MTEASEMSDSDIEDLAKQVESNRCRSYVWAAQTFAAFILARRRIPGPTISAVELPGWTCLACCAFNGEARMLLTECRCCGVAKGKMEK